MNKSDLVKRISASCNTTKAEAERLLNAVLDTITEELAEGNDVTLIGFGAFSVRSRAARIGRNPKTGAAIQVPASRVPAFKAGAALRKTIQNAQ